MTAPVAKTINTLLGAPSLYMDASKNLANSPPF